MKGFIEKSEKCRKKWFCTSQNISCPLVILSSFIENCFPQIPIIVSTRRKIAPTKKNIVSTSQKIVFHYPGKGFAEK